MDLNQALPYTILNLLARADQGIEDGDVFSFAGVDELNTNIDEDFSISPLEHFHSQSLGIDSLDEPHLTRMIFVEKKDDDGSGEVNEVRDPVGSRTC